MRCGQLFDVAEAREVATASDVDVGWSRDGSPLALVVDRAETERSSRAARGDLEIHHAVRAALRERIGLLGHHRERLEILILVEEERRHGLPRRGERGEDGPRDPITGSHRPPGLRQPRREERRAEGVGHGADRILEEDLLLQIFSARLHLERELEEAVLSDVADAAGEDRRPGRPAIERLLENRFASLEAQLA
jgi:hypothetical protein